MACCILVAAAAGALAWLAQAVLRLAGLRPMPAVAWRPRSEPAPPTALARRLASFGYACEGIGFVIRTQANMRIHLTLAGLVTAAGLLLRLPAQDWLWLVAATGGVLAAETMNTAIEQLCDLVSPGRNDFIKHAKDLAAGAVLIAAIAAAAIGAIVFGSAVGADPYGTLPGPFCF